jgi:hypothetical protein
MVSAVGTSVPAQSQKVGSRSARLIKARDLPFLTIYSSGPTMSSGTRAPRTDGVGFSRQGSTVPHRFQQWRDGGMVTGIFLWIFPIRPDIELVMPDTGAGSIGSGENQGAAGNAHRGRPDILENNPAKMGTFLIISFIVVFIFGFPLPQPGFNDHRHLSGHRQRGNGRQSRSRHLLHPARRFLKP